MVDSMRRPTVMIVDDAEENLMIMESILAQNYTPIVFSDAKLALEHALATPPDIVLLDIIMPDMDGFELCRRLKANPKFADIPIIFITAKNEDEYEENGFLVGASDFIHKPINAAILISRVKTHLKIKLVIDYLKTENVRLQKIEQHSSSELIRVIKSLCENPFLKI